MLPLGWSLMMGGIIGLFRPIVVPGSILRVAGALMLSPQCVWLQRALENCSARSPDVGRLLSRNSTFI